MPMRTLTCAELALTPDRTRCRVAGLVITRQRPGTASGVIFVTLEDETGIANVIVWPKVYERNRRAVIAGRLLRVTGQLQNEGSVRHLVAWRIEDLSHLLDRLGMPDTSGLDADEGGRPAADRRPSGGPRNHHPRDETRQLFPSRDFH
jgi:error-prone DNA polymerase